MQITGHTPTPWNLDSVEKCLVPAMARELYRGPTAKANAALIVLAVNNHAQLLNALTACLLEFDKLSALGEETPMQFKTRENARMAIFQAEG